MNTFYGTYIGKVVDNQDPTGGGRVRVFCSHPKISNYYATLLTKNSIQYKFPGNEDFSGDFIRIIKQYLPWARQIQPIIGGSAPAKFKAETNTASRTNDTEKFEGSSNTQYNPDGYPITAMEAMRHAEVFDAFAFPEGTMVAKGNPYGATDYLGPTYANKPSGMYNIPRVGSTVAVQFMNGDLNKPLVVGNYQEKESFQEMMRDGDVGIGQPGTFENP
jgi:hypothetical protein